MSKIEYGTEFLDQLKDGVHDLYDRNKELLSNNVKLREEKIKLKQEIERLKKENNILKKNAEHNDKVVDNVNWENMFFKKIIDKAIEYIEQHNDYFLLKREVKELLDILKGVDKE